MSKMVASDGRVGEESFRKYPRNGNAFESPHFCATTTLCRQLSELFKDGGSRRTKKSDIMREWSNERKYTHTGSQGNDDWDELEWKLEKLWGHCLSDGRRDNKYGPFRTRQ